MLPSETIPVALSPPSAPPCTNETSTPLSEAARSLTLVRDPPVSRMSSVIRCRLRISW